MTLCECIWRYTGICNESRVTCMKNYEWWLCHKYDVNYMIMQSDMCRCTKVGALLLTPLLVHGQSEPRAAATLSRAEEGSRREAEAQDN